MPLCTCGHEGHEHASVKTDYHDAPCTRCACSKYTERPVTTQSNWDIPVSQGARDLMERVAGPNPGSGPRPANGSSVLHALDILAAADERDVRNLLWARKAGKL